LLDPAGGPVSLIPDSPVRTRDFERALPPPLIWPQDIAAGFDLTPQDTTAADQEQIRQARPLAAAAIAAVMAEQAQPVGPIQNLAHQIVMFHAAHP
jgi:hypothetical protein